MGDQGLRRVLTLTGEKSILAEIRNSPFVGFNVVQGLALSDFRRRLTCHR